MKRRIVRAEPTPPDNRRGALSLAVLAFSGMAQAATLGDAEVRSSLGQPLEARIPVKAASGESLRGACFSLAPQGTAGAPALTEAELAFRRSAKGNFLEVRTRKPVQEPGVFVSIAIACPGGAPPLTRDFSLRVEAPLQARLPSAAASPVSLGARDGDTLQSIARAIVPDDAAARGDYLRALRDANPELAARGDDAVIGAREKIALPDLRTYARTPHRAAARNPAGTEAQAASRRAPAPKRLAQAPQLPDAVPAPRADAAGEPAASKPRQPAAAPASRARASNGSPFQLKLSGAEIDLTASRNIGERERAQLRERLAMLDADDQVAAMLSLRHSLKQLEARVAELQLKLSTMPAPLEPRQAPAAAPTAPEAPAPAPTPTPAPTQAAAPTLAPPLAPAPTPAPEAKVAAPKVEPAATPAQAPAVTAPPSTPAPSSAPATTGAPARVEPVIAPPPRASKPHLSVAGAEGADGRTWWWAVVAALAGLALLWSFLRWRRQRLAGDAWLDEPETAPPPMDEIAPASAAVAASDVDVPVITSDEGLPTRLPTNDAAELRRRYMEERFPELGTGMIDLEQAPSVVKAARLLYEDGAAPRAIELLQFALETHPGEVRHWLALFEIYRLERLTGEFGALALRFQQRFGETDHWQKVRYFGREIDPGNPLFQDPLDSLQTIGPRESRRLAAAASFDPLAENWLNAPMDFENEVLANELRSALMQKAGMKEDDLQANPTSALRHVEMFTVA